MRQTEFKAEKEKKFEDFFENEIPHEYSPLQYFDNRTTPLKPEKESFDIADKPWTNFLKQALLFLPGTFLLYFISMGTTLALTDEFKDNVFSKLGLLIYSVGLLSVFMTWFGLGDVKNRKHFVIPVSIIFSGALIGLIVRATAGIFWISEQIINRFEYAVCLLPIGLMIPVLAKGWVDRKSESD